MATAIITKYQGPTDTKGSAIVATHSRGADKTPERVRMGYDHGLNSLGNHQAAAFKLCPDDLGIISGEVSPGVYCHVLVPLHVAQAYNRA